MLTFTGLSVYLSQPKYVGYAVLNPDTSLTVSTARIQALSLSLEQFRDGPSEKEGNRDMFERTQPQECGQDVVLRTTKPVPQVGDCDEVTNCFHGDGVVQHSNSPFSPE